MGWQDAPLVQAPPASGNAWENAPELNAQPGVAEDIAKSGGSAIIRAIPAVAGIPGDLIKTAGGGIQWLAEKIARKVYGDEQVDKVKAERAQNPSFADRMIEKIPTSGDIMQVARQYAPGANYDPQTTAGKYARTVGELLPSAALGPGSIASKLVKFGALPGVASEAAGQATEGTAAEPYARAAAAFLSPIAPGLARAALPGSKTAEMALRQAMQGLTQAQMNDAARIMTTARGAGIRLTWPEAIQQATEGAKPGLASLQQMAETDLRGGATLGPIMGARPGEVENATMATLDTLSPRSQNPSAIGPMLSNAAEQEIRGVNTGITQRTAPLYTAAQADIIPAQEMRQLTGNPIYVQTLERIRATPELNRPIMNLPDDSAVVVNTVKQELEERGQRLARPLDADYSLTRSVANTESAREAREIARNASSNLDQALIQQAEMRRLELNPLQQGQLGQIGRANNTRGALEALLPSKPLPGANIETANTTGRLVANNPRLAAEAIRTRLEDQFTQAAKDLQGGQNQFGGANFRKAVYGTEPLRQNLRAAVEELPNGRQIADGLDDLMTSLQATGRREQVGSQTSQRQRLREDLQGGSGIGEILTSTGKLNPLGWVRDRYERWTLGQNMGDLAKIISDPDSQQKLIQLSQAKPGAEQATILRAAIVSRIMQGDDESQSNPSQALIDAMMPKNK